MRNSLIIVLSLFISTSLYAAGYGDYDAGKAFILKQDDSGHKFVNVDSKYLNTMLSDLSAHAGYYPPKFDSEADRQKAVKDAKKLSELLDIINGGPNKQENMLMLGASVHSLAHNLDIRGAAEKANNLYLQLLSLKPDNAQVNFRYGVFLAGTGKLNESIPYLNKALAAGLKEANFTLGMVHLTIGEKEKGLNHLKAYKEAYPHDPNTSKIIEAVESGKFTVKRQE
ncbi:MAG: hypothetical protein PHN75_18865 [Syntrophales bacterium]|nr:hypothetical protein [Syntrophales bacterium]